MIGMNLQGVVTANQNGRPPGTAGNAAAVGDILAAPRIFPHFNANRAVVATNATLYTAARVRNHLAQLGHWLADLNGRFPLE